MPLFVVVVDYLFGFVWLSPWVVGITRMHSNQRHAVVLDKVSLAAGEQQEAYRWVPCSRKTKIARRHIGLQCISRVVLNT